MKKTTHDVNTLKTELVHTLSPTQQAQTKGGLTLLGITCEEKRGIITGKPYMAMTGVTIMGMSLKWG